MGKNKNKKRIKTEDGGLVYSTNKEVMNSLFNELENLLDGTNEQGNKDVVLRLRIEKKGRAGKVVTVINYGNLTSNEAEQLAIEIKKHFGTGGSIKNGEIIIQGDIKEKLRSFLNEKGYAVKG